MIYVTCHNGSGSTCNEPGPRLCRASEPPPPPAARPRNLPCFRSGRWGAGRPGPSRAPERQHDTTHNTLKVNNVSCVFYFEYFKILPDGVFCSVRGRAELLESRMALGHNENDMLNGNEYDLNYTNEAQPRASMHIAHSRCFAESVTMIYHSII